MRVPVWNVYIYNINLQKIEVYNIFNHGTFNAYCRKALEEAKDKNEFARLIKNELR